MPTELPIIDAEFVDLPNPGTPISPSKSTKLTRIKTKQTKALAMRSSNEGRLDVLIGNMAGAIFQQTFGPNPHAANALNKAATMMVGRKKLKGPEWDLLKALTGN